MTSKSRKASPKASKADYVEGMFAHISRRYDLLNTVMTLGLHHRWKAMTARIAAMAGEGPALDVATGTGDLAFQLAKQGSVTGVVGIDFCPEMLQLGHAKARKTCFPKPIYLVLGDALDLPFPNDFFICATSGFALRNVDDIHRSIAEMYRVVRPGGRVTTLELTPLRSTPVLRPFLRAYFRFGVPLLGQVLAGNREAYTYLPNSVQDFPAAEELRDLFREIGMVDVRFKRLNLGSVAIHWGRKPQ